MTPKQREIERKKIDSELDIQKRELENCFQEFKHLINDQSTTIIQDEILSYIEEIYKQQIDTFMEEYNDRDYNEP